MMDVIHKEELAIEDYQSVKIAGFDRILSFGVQHGKLCMWFQKETNSLRQTVVRIRIKGTGYTFESSELQGYKFQGTYQMQDGALVWHVFTSTQS